MPRIALLTWAFRPAKSGLARAAVDIAETLVEAGAEVTVIAADRPAGACATEGAITVAGARPGRALGWLRRRGAVGHLAAPLAFAAALRRLGRFDVVEATNWYAPGLFAPRLVTRHSTPAAISGAAESLRDRLDGRAVEWTEARAARRSAGHISNTRHHAATVAALYGIPPEGPRHAVIGLRVSPDLARRADARAGTPRQAGHILFIGRGTSRKGWDLVAGALAALATEPGWRATLVGCGEAEAGDLDPAIRDRCACVKFIEDDRLADLLAAAAVVLAPSRYESFGLVYREALVFGAPVVALASEPSAAEFFATTPGGHLADAEPGALAAALRPLLRPGPAHLAARAGGRAVLEHGRLLGRQTLDAYRGFGLLA